jgi:putative membrane protein
MKRNLFAVAAMLLAACATAPQQIPAGGDLTDNEIAAIVSKVNEGEVMHGEIARSRATNSEVRAFAEMMVTDHTRAMDRARDVFAKANAQPMENELSRTLGSSAEQTAAALRAMTGSELDRAYMRTQVEMHDWALRSLDTSLIPSARSPQMVMYLRDIRAAVAAHRERARQIQGRL